MIPKYLYLKLCQAVLEAAQNMGDKVSECNPQYVTVPFELLAAMKVIVANHPEADVRAFYLEEIDRLTGLED